MPIWREIIYTHTVADCFPGGLRGKESSCQCRKRREMWVGSLGQEDPLEKEMATHLSILTWRIPVTEGLGGL